MGDLLVDVTGAHQVQEATATFHAEEINRGMTFSVSIFTKKAFDVFSCANSRYAQT